MMKIEIRKQLIIIFPLMLTGLIILSAVLLFTKNINAWVTPDLHQKTIYELANHTSANQSFGIEIGQHPVSLYMTEDTVYVANLGDNTVSVIDINNNTKIKDIKVGKGPNDIGFNEKTNTIYVANEGDQNNLNKKNDGSVSVIDGKNNSIIKNINTGNGSFSIGVNEKTNTIYVTNPPDNTVSVIDGKNYINIKNITVGKGPSAIFVDPDGSKIYVANYMNGSISVIDGKNNSIIKNITTESLPSTINGNSETIYVANLGSNTVSVINASNDVIIGNLISGKSPSAIEFNGDKRYVANYDDGTISVIDADNNTIIKNITVGKGPSAIAANILVNKIYVANKIDDTVSVIDATDDNNINIKNITVGKGPSAIKVDSTTNTTYVANYDDGTISVIDGETDKVVDGVKFEINPFNSGHIECDKDKSTDKVKIIVPLSASKQSYINAGSKCIAKPSQGFEFVSWQENLNGNSTQMLQAAPAPSVLDSILDLFHMKPDKPEATLPITKFGSFTANFKALPPPVPAEYWTTLFGFVLTTILGTVLIPIFLTWRKSKSQGKKLEYYSYKINGLYDDGRLDGKDIDSIDFLRNNITNEYTKGKINKEQFDKLVDETSIKYRDF